MTQTTTPHIAVLALGGTIASRPGQGDGALVRPGLTADELAAVIGEPAGLPPVRTETLLQAPSGDLTFADMAGVARRIGEAVAEGAVGVVVTQGTDTLEESAFLLDLLLNLPQPVVMTGALRNPTLPGADGAANLLAALQVASAPAAAGLGVLAVLNDEIHAARFVRKLHTHKPSAFASPAAGPLGWIAEDRVRIALRPAEPTPTIPWRGEPPEAPVLFIGFSASAAVLAPFLADPPAGLVIAGLGAGHVPAALVEGIGALAARIPVVLASRIGTGEVFRATYGYAGSESDLLGRGCIGAGCLDPAKARLLLALLLADGAGRDRVRQAFSRF